MDLRGVFSGGGLFVFCFIPRADKTSKRKKSSKTYKLVFSVVIPITRLLDVSQDSDIESGTFE